jgi:Zn finger protein HypA/HybF involved in hydrogenase expression
MKIEIIKNGFQCERCNHEWIGRLYKNEIPIICPKCKSAYWNKPKRDANNDTTKKLD